MVKKPQKALFSSDQLDPLVSGGRGELLLAEHDGLVTKVTRTVGGDGQLTQVSAQQVGRSHLQYHGNQ